MGMVDKIQQNVQNGQVLDDDGSWISIDKRLEVTKKIIDRLASGKVLSEGRWVSIAEAKEILKNGAPLPTDTKGHGLPKSRLKPT